MGSLHNNSTRIEGDALHLNDVEPFPESMEEGFFKRGDVLVSLRNINTVFVFNRHTDDIKLLCAGMFVRQHDPDFMDGDTFSVFDNNNDRIEALNPQSRIVIVSAIDRSLEVYYEGSPNSPFHTVIMGKHQWLPNGNLLVTESVWGRAFELNPDGEIVWQYVNYVDDGVVGYVQKVHRIPSRFRRLYKGPASEHTARSLP